MPTRSHDRNSKSVGWRPGLQARLGNKNAQSSRTRPPNLVVFTVQQLPVVIIIVHLRGMYDNSAEFHTSVYAA